MHACVCMSVRAYRHTHTHEKPYDNLSRQREKYMTSIPDLKKNSQQIRNGRKHPWSHQRHLKKVTVRDYECLSPNIRNKRKTGGSSQCNQVIKHLDWKEKSKSVFIHRWHGCLCKIWEIYKEDTRTNKSLRARL